MAMSDEMISLIDAFEHDIEHELIAR